MPSSSLFEAPGLNGKVRLRWCRPEAHALKPSQDHWLRSVLLLSEKPNSLHSGALTSDGPQYTSVGALPPVMSGLHLSMQTWLLQILPWLASIYESILLSWHVMNPPTCVIPHLTLLSRLQRTSKWNLIKSPVKSLTVSTLVTLFFRN